MNIVTIAGLDPAFRVYQTDAGLYVRVKVEKSAEDATDNSVTFCLTAEVCDEAGMPTSGAIRPVYWKLGIAEIEAPIFSDSASQPSAAGSPGELVRYNARLYQYDSEQGTWIDRGPIDPGASETAAEYLAVWDQIAREEVTKAETAAGRLAASSEIDSLIGA